MAWHDQCGARKTQSCLQQIPGPQSCLITSLYFITASAWLGFPRSKGTRWLYIASLSLAINPFISKVTSAGTWLERVERCRKVTGWAPSQAPARTVQESQLQLCLMSSQEVPRGAVPFYFRHVCCSCFPAVARRTWLPHPRPVPLPFTFQAHICLYNYASSGENGT